MLNIRLPDADDPAPAETVVSLSAVDGNTFISIEKYTETYETSHYETIARIMVETTELHNALVTVWTNDYNEGVYAEQRRKETS